MNYSPRVLRSDLKVVINDKKTPRAVRSGTGQIEFLVEDPSITLKHSTQHQNEMKMVDLLLSVSFYLTIMRARIGKIIFYRNEELLFWLLGSLVFTILIKRLITL